MALNCLPCSKITRTDSSEKHNLQEEARAAHVRPQVDRILSGRGNRGLGPLAKIKTDHRRVHSVGDCPEPRLVRSPAVRRDWSFDDLVFVRQHR